MVAENASSIKKKLRQAVRDVRKIMQLVNEAEMLRWPDERALGDLYALAMNAVGPMPLQTAPNEYGELCVRRLQVLCRADPQEARTFNSFLMHYGIKQEDSRLRRAVDLLGRGSIASALAAGSPPAVQAPDQAPAPFPCTGRGSSTPIRPRALSYSNCDTNTYDTSDLEEIIAAVAARTCDEDEAAEQGKGGEQPAPTSGDVKVGLEKRRAAERSHDLQAFDAKQEEVISTARLSGRVSIMENLSPIPEDQAADDTPCGQAPIAPAADLPIVAPPLVDSTAAPAKTFVVNGVPYTKVQIIGRGGSSKVYQVRSPSGQLLALKRATATCPKHFEALANEVTLLRQLKDCPYIIQVFDSEVLPDRLAIHIVMEEGQKDLGRLLQEETDFSLGDLQALWRQMVEAVQVIHNERIVHSDLKPANFLLVGKRLKLIDFGIAKKIASNTTNISRETSVGTISYMAPEAVKPGGALKIGRPSDIWSLGIILYQMVYLEAPFAHLDPMQRIFALTDRTMRLSFRMSTVFRGTAQP